MGRQGVWEDAISRPDCISYRSLAWCVAALASCVRRHPRHPVPNSSASLGVAEEALRVTMLFTPLAALSAHVPEIVTRNGGIYVDGQPFAPVGYTSLL